MRFAPPAALNPANLPITLLSRVEEAGINSSAPLQQRWVDGWLLRFSPGKAKRARCILAVADSYLPLAERLALCAAVLAEAGLPMVVRITPFGRPEGLDASLAELVYEVLGDTRVMVATQWPVQFEPLPVAVGWSGLDTPLLPKPSAACVDQPRASVRRRPSGWPHRPCLIRVGCFGV